MVLRTLIVDVVAYSEQDGQEDGKLLWGMAVEKHHYWLLKVSRQARSTILSPLSPFPRLLQSYEHCHHCLNPHYLPWSSYTSWSQFFLPITDFLWFSLIWSCHYLPVALLHLLHSQPHYCWSLECTIMGRIRCQVCISHLCFPPIL